MRASALPWLTATLLLVHAAEQQPSCDSQTCAAAKNGDHAATRTQLDSVSLLQSRGIHVEYGDDTDIDGSNAPSLQDSPVKAALFALLTRSGLAQTVGFGWSTLIIPLVLLGLCWFLCAVVGYAKILRKEDQLETRVTSVLQPQKVREDLAQPPQSSEELPAGASPQLSVGNLSTPRSSEASRRSPFMAKGAQAPDSLGDVPVQDMPPPLATSSTPLISETRLLLDKGATLGAIKGGDLTLLAHNSAPLMRATVRKVDGDFWLEVSMHAEGSSPSAMIRLTNKDAAAAGVSFFGPRTPTGPELYGPDGSFYGTMEISSVGARLLSSTTALSVLDIGGDMQNLQLTARTKSGLELATVSCCNTGGNDNIEICIHRGADLGLIVSSVLTVLLSPQL